MRIRESRSSAKTLKFLPISQVSFKTESLKGLKYILGPSERKRVWSKTLLKNNTS